MREVLLKRRELDYTEYVKHSAKLSEVGEILVGGVIGIDEDTKQVLFIQKTLDIDPAEMLWALNRIKYETNIRTAGLKSTSRIFGYNPRNSIRKDYCSATSLAFTQPKEHAIVCQFGAKVAKLYAEHRPEAYRQHDELVKSKVLDEWAIKDTPFTSGIINKNNPLKYHFDTGNFNSVYSCMVTFKHDIAGGHLAMPEYGIAVNLPSNSVFMFDGQSILHGVTPIQELSKDAARYTVVYYSLKQIWKCLPLSEEVARVRNRRMDKEQRRAKGQVHETFSSNTK